MQKKNPPPESFLFRVWIKDKYRWDLWQDDVKIVVAISEKDAALKFTTMNGFDEHYYVSNVEKISLAEIESLLK